MKKITLWLSFVLMMFITTMNAQEDFETATVGALPTGWTSYQSASDDPGFTVQDGTGLAHGGDQYLAHLGVDVASESTSWVVSPAQTISSAYELRFFWRGKWSRFYNFSGVYISTTSSDPVANPGDFTLLEEFTPANYPNTWLNWNEAMYDLSAYSGQVYIAFKYVGDHAHDFFIDDVSVGPIPYCEVPGSIDIENRYMDSLDISWDGVPGHDDYEVVWGAPGFDPDAAGITPTLLTITTNPKTYTIAGLAQSTQYDIYVRTACSSYNFSSWVGPKVGFTSGPPPANDDCDNAIALTVNADLNCGVVTSGTTLDATASSQADDVAGTPNNDVWYSFVATNTRHVIALSNVVAVMGSGYQADDMAMGLYDGTAGCSSLTLVEDSDPNSMLVSGLTVGSTYLLRVYGYYSSLEYAQTFDVCVSTPPPPPANDLCAGAEMLTVYPEGASAGNETTANTSYVTDSGAHPTCDNTGVNYDLYYTFTVPAGVTGVKVITGGNKGNKIEAALYDACGGIELDCQGRGSAKILTGLTPGTTYTLQVWHDGGSSQGEFDIAIEIAPQPPVNDDISGAIPITPSPEGTGCNSAAYTFQAWQGGAGATDSGMDGSCNGANTGLDVFYTWTATSIGLMWNDGDGNPGIVIRDANANEITCSGTYASTDTMLSGWAIGDDLIIQIYDYGAADVDVSFCLEEVMALDPEFRISVVPDCANNQFSIDVNVFNLGGATSVTVADDQSSATQQLSAPGVVTFGPYAFGVNVTFTVTNDQYSTHTVSESIQVDACPPTNDLCTGAIPLTVETSLQAVTGNNTSATDSGIADPGCADYSGGDLWYSVVVPSDGNVTVESTSVAGSDVSDTGIAAYSGTCGSLTLIDCNDDIGSPNYFSSIDVTGATPGETLYVRVWQYGNDTYGEIGVGAYNANLSVSDNAIEGFNYYPNPVTNTLNISAKDDIQNVSIFDISGKQVINVRPNALETNIDFSSLKSGIYFVKASVSDKMTAFKIIKE